MIFSSHTRFVLVAIVALRLHKCTGNSFQVDGEVIEYSLIPFAGSSVADKFNFQLPVSGRRSPDLITNLTEAILTLESKYLDKMLSSREPVTFSVSKNNKDYQVEAALSKDAGEYRLHVHTD